MSQEQVEQPNVINLDPNNSIQILIKYTELAQKNGAYELREADIIKRSIDVLTNNVQDAEVTPVVAVNLLIQSVVKGQKSGAYTLNDAALLHKVITYIVQLSQQQNPEQAQAQAPQQEIDNKTEDKTDSTEDDDDDLTSLSDPVPLRPKEI